VEVDSVKDGATDLLLVAGDGHGGTTAFFHRIAVIATWAPVRIAVAIGSACHRCTFAMTSTPRADGTNCIFGVMSGYISMHRAYINLCRLSRKPKKLILHQARWQYHRPNRRCSHNSTLFPESPVWETTTTVFSCTL
jgi:hypothetical protein